MVETIKPFRFKTLNRCVPVGLLISLICLVPACTNLPHHESKRGVQRFSEQDTHHNRSTTSLFDTLREADNAYQDQRWSSAATLYQQALSDLPEEPYLWFRLGNALTQEGQYTEAIAAFESSIRYDASQAKPWFNLATAHLLQAQLATLQARTQMNSADPALTLADQRLHEITDLLK